MRKVNLKRRNNSGKKQPGGKDAEENGSNQHNEEDSKSSNNSVQSEEKSDDEEYLEKTRSGRPRNSKRSLPKKLTHEESEDEPEPETKKSKKRKSVTFSSKQDKEESEKKVEDQIENDDDEQFEVEAVLDDKKINNVCHYLIRWKGYGPESDTWEPESTLNCSLLIKKYQNSKKSGKSKKNTQKVNVQETYNEDEEFEVDKILEVHFKRNGEREFLVSWKGYPASQNSWEPEENLQCPELIEKFLEKVENAKNTTQRELREYRKPTERLTLNTPEKSRRLSKRLGGRQRVQYHETE